MRFPEFVAFRQRSTTARDLPAATVEAPAINSNDGRTPDDLIDDGYRQLREALIIDIRERIASMPPARFEQLVVDLLTEMGYGGPQEDAGLVVGRGGDEGIDGVIKEDRLGLETIYIQAKRWQGTVGRPEIQRFAVLYRDKEHERGSSLRPHPSREKLKSTQTLSRLE